MKFFGSHRFDEESGTLWNGSRRVAITPKAAQVLRRLTDQAGSPVTTGQLLKDVWPGVHVHPANVKALIHELRLALGDSSSAPRYVRSEPGRGYTFIAGATSAPVPMGMDPAPVGGQPGFSGHEAAFEVLAASLDDARGGQTRVVIIEGEKGIGKTTIVRRLAQEARAQGGVRISCGQACGSAAPGAVLADAFALLGRQYPELAASLGQASPAWAERSRPLQTVADAWGAFAREPGPLRHELGAAVAHYASGAALLLVLEDLERADGITIDALRRLACTAAPAGTCVVLTFTGREGPSVDALRRLQVDLAHEPAVRLVHLQALSPEEVSSHIERQFGAWVARELSPVLVSAAAGHPHMTRTAVDQLIALELLRSSGGRWALQVHGEELSALVVASISDTWRQLVNQLSPEMRRLLEAASSFGVQFSAADVAALVDAPMAVVGPALALEAARGILIDRARLMASQPLAFTFRSPVVVDLLAATSNSLDSPAPALHKQFSFA